MLEVVLEGPGPVVASRIGTRPLYVGRSDTNDLVLRDETVSSRHLGLWLVGTQVMVEDLKSRNGTFIGKHRVRGVEPVPAGSAIRVGLSTMLRIEGEPPPVPEQRPRAAFIEDVSAGVRIPFVGDRFTIGSDPSSNLVVGGSAARSATLLRFPDGHVALGEGVESFPMEPGQPVDVAGRTLVLALAEGVSAKQDAAAQDDVYPYALSATLEGSTGPEASIRNMEVERVHLVTAANRATLLYVLARQHEADRAHEPDARRWGWCLDTQIISAIWGRVDSDAYLNNLNVLLSRTRRELKHSGFDPWMIEKRQRHIRLRVRSAQVR